MEKAQVNSTSTGQEIFQIILDPPSGGTKKKHFGELAQLSLAMGLCPYCDTDEIEGFQFGGSDNREGGFLNCRYCKVQIAWIDNPFEAEELWYED